MKKLILTTLLIMLFGLTSCVEHSEEKQNNNQINNNLINFNTIDECDGAVTPFAIYSFNDAKKIYYETISADSVGDIILLDLDRYDFFMDGGINLLFAKKKENPSQFYSKSVTLSETYYSLGMNYKFANNNNERTQSKNKILIEVFNIVFDFTVLPSYNIDDYEISLRGVGLEYIENGETKIYKGYRLRDESEILDTNYSTNVPLYGGVLDLCYQGKKYCSFTFYCEEHNIELVQNLIKNNIVLLHR